MFLDSPELKVSSGTRCRTAASKNKQSPPPPGNIHRGRNTWCSSVSTSSSKDVRHFWTCWSVNNSQTPHTEWRGIARRACVVVPSQEMKTSGVDTDVTLKQKGAGGICFNRILKTIWSSHHDEAWRYDCGCLIESATVSRRVQHPQVSSWWQENTRKTQTDQGLQDLANTWDRWRPSVVLMNAVLFGRFLSIQRRCEHVFRGSLHSFQETRLCDKHLFTSLRAAAASVLNSLWHLHTFKVLLDFCSRMWHQWGLASWNWTSTGTVSVSEHQIRDSDQMEPRGSLRPDRLLSDTN